jgi:hypothetical protein
MGSTAVAAPDLQSAYVVLRRRWTDDPHAYAPLSWALKESLVVYCRIEAYHVEWRIPVCDTTIGLLRQVRDHLAGVKDDACARRWLAEICAKLGT